MNYPNVSGYDEKGFAPPLKPGSYIVKIDDIKTEDNDGYKLKDKNGEEFVNFVFAVDGKPNKVFERFYFNPDGEFASIRLGRFKQMLLAIGADVSGGEMHNLLGRVCRVTLKISEYKDKNGDTKQINNILAFEPKNANDNFGDPEEADLPY